MKDGNFITNFSEKELTIKEPNKLEKGVRLAVANELLKGRKLHELVPEFPTLLYDYTRLK